MQGYILFFYLKSELISDLKMFSVQIDFTFLPGVKQGGGVVTVLLLLISFFSTIFFNFIYICFTYFMHDHLLLTLS